MDHGLGKGPPVRLLAEEKEGGAAIEFALVGGLAAFFALTMKALLAMPLLDGLSKATVALSRALSG